MKWQKGRQNSNYENLLLLQGKTWDCYLIRYPIGGWVRKHVDPVPVGYKHYRLNIILRGEDCYRGAAIWKWWRFTLFRPDIHKHSVKPTIRKRLILSIGWITKDK